MNRKRIIRLLACFAVLTFLLLPAQAADQESPINPILYLLLSGSTTMKEKTPSLALMVSKDTDKIEMAWVPGSDGITPVNQIQYSIYLSTSENFTPGPANLKKTVTGTSQTEITDLATDTLYYGKVVAEYSASTSPPSNSLQAKTYKYKALLDNSTTVAKAVDLGLGKHTTTDGTTYTYAGGTPPDPGSALFSEDTAGGMTLRTVDSTSSSGGVVTVYTSDASLTDVLDRGSIYSSFQLFDVAAQAKDLPTSSKKIATAKSFTRKDGSQYSRMDWKSKLLFAEQTNYAYSEEDLIVIPQGKTSIIKLINTKDVDQSFIATVTAEFEPQLITTAEWGDGVFKHLDSAKVAAKGILSLTALAQYDFSAAGLVSKNFQLFKRTWVSVYSAGPVPVYQKITLSMNIAASASAQAKIQAMAQANLTESVEVGARYDGSTWTPYITHNESDSLTASLDIVGEANAEIRIIPKVEVEFYKVVNSSLTVEPFAKSSLTFEKTTNNIDFLMANQLHLIQLTSFDASLGMESNVAVTLSALGYSWDALPSTCVLGTGSCLYTFDDIDLFSIPKLVLSTTSSSGIQTDLKLQVEDGDFNPFNQSSVKWEVFPDDATLTQRSCSKSGTITSCAATFEPGAEEKYTIFVSGHGKLGEIGRQFKEMTMESGTCASGPQTVMWQGREWQRCDDDNSYRWEWAKTYCSNLILSGYSDWRLPNKDELKSLVVCTNGTPTPLADYPDHPFFCGDGAILPYDSPTIDEQFLCDDRFYWSSSAYEEDSAWATLFRSGSTDPYGRTSLFQVRCVR